jgi:hypothetical protein
MTRVEEVSHSIQMLLHGLGQGAQGAILADLVSLWLAGHWELDELHRLGQAGPATIAIRVNIFEEWRALVLQLLAASEREILERVETRGSA